MAHNPRPLSLSIQILHIANITKQQRKWTENSLGLNSLKTINAHYFKEASALLYLFHVYICNIIQRIDMHIFICMNLPVSVLLLKLIHVETVETMVAARLGIQSASRRRSWPTLQSELFHNSIALTCNTLICL